MTISSHFVVVFFFSFFHNKIAFAYPDNICLKKIHILKLYLNNLKSFSVSMKIYFFLLFSNKKEKKKVFNQNQSNRKDFKRFIILKFLNLISRLSTNLFKYDNLFKFSFYCFFVLFSIQNSPNFLKIILFSSYAI